MGTIFFQPWEWRDCVFVIGGVYITMIRRKAKIVRVQVAPTPGPSPNAGGGETARFPVLLPLSQYGERGLGGEGLNAYGTPWRTS